MKKLLISILILCSFVAKSQSWTQIAGKQRFGSGLGIPVKDSTSFSTSSDTALIYINKSDTTALYWRYRGLHLKIFGGGDTTSLSNRINQRVKYTDTASMLSPYAKDSNVVHRTLNETIFGEKTFKSAFNNFHDNSAGTAYLRFITQTSGNIGSIAWTGGGLFMRAGAGSYFSLGSNDSNDRLRIESNGNVTVGSNIDSSSYRFQITGSTLLSGVAKYATNYGSLFDSRSLVNKGYVDSTNAVQVDLTSSQTITGYKSFTNGAGFPGTTTFGTGSPTAFDGTDGKLVISKIRVYNSVPSTQYHDITSAATQNRSILLPNADGTVTLGTGAAGQVTFFTSTNNVSSDVNLFWDNTNKRLGINTTGAGVPLGVYLPSGSNGQIIKIARSAGAYAWGIGVDANSLFSVYNNAGNARLTIQDVGITTLVNSTSLSLSANSTAGLFVGDISNASGSSLFIKTGSLSSSFASGFGIDGTYSGGNSQINIRGIGTQTTGGYASSFNFVLDNNGVTRSHATFNTDGSSTFSGNIRSNSAGVPLVANSTNSNTLKLQFINNGTNVGYVGASSTNALEIGNSSATIVATINASTGAYTATSDSTLKKNIADADSALPLILKTKIRKYNWKSNNVYEPFGVIAQELYQVMPEYVSKPSDSTGKWGVQKAEMVPILLKAIQEQQSQIDELKKQVAELMSIKK
ncbi:MAG: tail fiber domain-containing protein [Chitinophagia bacterium]|jgi:hypothetical protein